VREEGETAIIANVVEGPRRERILKVFRRYCDGESLRQIVESTGHVKCTVSQDLHNVQDMIDKPFLRVQTQSVRRRSRRRPRSSG